MKLQIRPRIFETNSSSTHSLTCCESNKIEDTIKHIFWKNIDEHEFDYGLNFDDYDNIVVVEGLDLPSGYEESSVYIIFMNWEAKVQVLLNYLFNNLHPNDALIEDVKDIILSELKRRGHENITDVIIDEESIKNKGTWFECDEINMKNFIDVFKTYITGENSLIYSDEAYSSDGMKILIY